MLSLARLDNVYHAAHCYYLDGFDLDTVFSSEGQSGSSEQSKAQFRHRTGRRTSGSDVERPLGELTMVVWLAHHQTVVADSQERLLISG